MQRFRYSRSLLHRHRFLKMGCTLGAIDRFAYAGQPAEVRLLWWKAPTSPDTNSS